MTTIIPIKDSNIQESKIKPLKLGETVEGAIVGIGRSSVFLDLGIQGAGIIFGKEFNDAKHILEKMKKGDKIAGKVIDLENEDGYIELSAAKASREIAWKDLREKKEKRETIKIKVSGANKGGLLANVEGIQGFLPVSQLSAPHYPQIKNPDQVKILQELQKFIGKEFEVKILEFSPKDNKLVLSEKVNEFDNSENILKNYKEGGIVEGVISKVVDFGVFIRFPLESIHGSEDIGQDSKDDSGNSEKVEGLAHISELDWEMIDNPKKMFEPGQNVKAKIIKIAQSKVSLSIKALKPNPWENISKEYKKGDKVKGEVVKIDTFGLLVKLPSKIQGLCHISEFESKEKMREQIKIARTYDFEILSVDEQERKILLKHIPSSNL